MELAESGLQGVRAEGCGTILAEPNKVVFSLHPSHDGGLGHHRLDTQRGRRIVLERFTRLEDGLPPGNSSTLNHILGRRTHGLDLETAGYQLDRSGRLVRDADVVLEAVLVLSRIGPLRLVARGDADANSISDGVGGIGDVNAGTDIAGFHIGLAGEGGTGGGPTSFGGRCLGSLGSGVFLLVVFLFFSSSP